MTGMFTSSRPRETKNGVVQNRFRQALASVIRFRGRSSNRASPHSSKTTVVPNRALGGGWAIGTLAPLTALFHSQSTPGGIHDHDASPYIDDPGASSQEKGPMVNLSKASRLNHPTMATTQTSSATLYRRPADLDIRHVGCPSSSIPWRRADGRISTGKSNYEAAGIRKEAAEIGSLGLPRSQVDVSRQPVLSSSTTRYLR